MLLVFLHFFIFVIGEKKQKEKENDETAVEPWVTWLHEMGVDEGATDCQIISHTGVDTHYAGVDKKECKITTKYQMPMLIESFQGIMVYFLRVPKKYHKVPKNTHKL